MKPRRADTGLVCDLEDTAMLDHYFGGVLNEPKSPLGPPPASVQSWTKVSPSEGTVADPLPGGPPEQTGAL